jgi:hypothetical protein
VALDLVQAVTAAGETDKRAAAGAVLDAAREALLAELAGEVVFALSQGGKELFHTNLLAWFAERYPPVARALLAVANADAAPHGVRAFREWKKLDLVLDAVGPDGALGGSLLVVENKLFALTDTDQLERYGAAVESLSGPPALALLTLVDPGWADGTWADSSGRQWTRISYASVADALRNAAPELPDGFDRQVLIKWADHQDRLHRLAALFGRPDDDEPVLLPKPVRARLERVRLDATVQKMRYQWLVRRVLDRTGGLPDGTRINADVTRANGLAQGWVLMSDGREVGWQLQSGQWRRPMLFPEGDRCYGAGDRKHAARSRAAAWWTRTASFPSGRAVVPADGSLPSHRRYSPDFVYRYVAMPDATVAEVTDLAIATLAEAHAAADSA